MLVLCQYDATNSFNDVIRDAKMVKVISLSLLPVIAEHEGAKLMEEHKYTSIKWVSYTPEFRVVGA